MIKNITIVLCGILFGGIITVFIAYYYYNTHFSKQNALITPETADYLGTLGDPVNEKFKNINSLTFRQAPLITQSTPSVGTIQSFNLIQTDFAEITKSNNAIIYKGLLTLKEKTIKTEWSGIFDLVTSIKVEIEKNTAITNEISKELAKLESANVPEYTNLIQKSRSLITALTEYFSSIDKILVGKIPSKEDTMFVNSKVEQLSNAYWEYDTATSDFLKNI